MKKTLFLFSSALLCLNVSAQEAEPTNKQKFQSAIADKFPFARVFDVKYTQYLPKDFESKLFDEDFIEGRIKNQSKLNIAANLPVIMKPKWNVTASAAYKYEHADIDQVVGLNDLGQSFSNHSYDRHYISGALSFTYFSTLFKKPFIYNASVITDGDERAAQRIKGFVGGTIVVKANAKTKIAVGAIVLIDPASPVPAAPVFTLEHKFNSGWIIDIILPQRAFIKHDIFTNGRLYLGTELIADGFYLNSTQPGFAKVYDYRQLETRSGATYEHWFGDGLIGTFKVGLANVFNSRVTERGESTNDYILSTTQNGTGYFSVGFSYNPFTKRGNKAVKQ
ncbi:hypothetical protein FMM05_04565 [Flavobacterium zepuense]|uniref:DUF4421 domain-containing protein n=1 Tax=Flavobacterium zepuense TaxID=2593302 RepID=A0A552V869_9FLAO|nr:hypothetical protein [Flavobacterium zepuense]TRW26655.1 hypothetical protein FMM05_04565 [Flavobacterium zepuense]